MVVMPQNAPNNLANEPSLGEPLSFEGVSSRGWKWNQHLEGPRFDQLDPDARYGGFFE